MSRVLIIDRAGVQILYFHVLIEIEVSGERPIVLIVYHDSVQLGAGDIDRVGTAHHVDGKIFLDANFIEVENVHVDGLSKVLVSSVLRIKPVEELEGQILCGLLVINGSVHSDSRQGSKAWSGSI